MLAEAEAIARAGVFVHPVQLAEGLKYGGVVF